MSRIIVENLGKKYKRYATPWQRLLEALSGGRLVRHEAHWVLRGVSFETGPGESLGIVGQNGAGKSTLLKILVGTTAASEGAVRCEGRVAALLELGMGFHPDFTGRHNAIMGCQLMGLPGALVRDVLPDIIAFSELGADIDQPFRTYSSGMQMRLAFSVATAVRPEILIVDEALAVGDAYFQHKSVGRIRQFREQGTTLLFVSHDPGAVKSLCDRAILLDDGILVRDGAPDAVLDYYNAIIAKQTKDLEVRQVEQQYGRTVTRSGTGEARLVSVEMNDEQGRPTRAYRVGDEAEIACKVRFAARVEEPTVGILIRDRLGNDVFGTSTFHLHQKWPVAEAEDVLGAQFRLALNLGPGQYSLTVAAHTGHTHLEHNFDWWDNLLAFQVIPGNGPLFIGVAALQVSGGWVAGHRSAGSDWPSWERTAAQADLPATRDSREAEGLVCELVAEVENRHVNEGGVFRVTVQGRNTSEAIWLPSSMRPGGVRIGCHLLNPQEDMLDGDYFRATLSDAEQPIHPGDSFSRTFLLPAPGPGQYVLEIDLVSENVCWFATNASRPVRISISVDESRNSRPEDAKAQRQAGQLNQDEHADTKGA
jgi:lipopolysaccharide transport system ATP-binding protein